MPTHNLTKASTLLGVLTGQACNEDKCTLHDMLDAALEGLQHTGGTDNASLDRRDADYARFRDLVKRLFR